MLNLIENRECITDLHSVSRLLVCHIILYLTILYETEKIQRICQQMSTKLPILTLEMQRNQNIFPSKDVLFDFLTIYL